MMQTIVTLFSVFFFGNVFGHYYLDRFEDWVRQFRIRFSQDNQYDVVYRKWVDNDKFIQLHNAKNLSFTLGHNQFSGMDSNEFREYLRRSKIESHLADKFNAVDNTKTSGMKTFFESFFRDSDVDDDQVESFVEMFEIGETDEMTRFLRSENLPTYVNWVEKGAVTTPKDQCQCGSCWSFSTTGALEGAYATKYGNLVSFSEQQLVDCDNLKNGGKDHGCNGGLMDNAFSWITKNGGLCSEKDYPYVSGTTQTSGTCQSKCSNIANSKIVKHVDVPPKSDDAMMNALTLQPVSVAIEADQREFQLYKSGVFTTSCGTNLDHGVLVVGYGTSNGQDYYLVKNSWGTSWGDGGYIMLGRGPSYNNGAGQCGVLLEASYPVL